MGLFGKILFGGLGWTLGGPIGAIIGVLLASIFDNAAVIQKEIGSGQRHGNTQTYTSTQRNTRQTTGANDFRMALLVLMAGIMKADGRVVKSELNSVKQVLLKNYGEEGALEALQVLKQLLSQDIDVRQVAMQCSIYLTYSLRLQMLHILYDIAVVDGDINRQEETLLHVISADMGITEADRMSIAAMFAKQSNNSDWAYKVLEIPADATDEEVKKAYRRMAMKYHPDKVNTLDENMKQSATEKFRKVKEAYDTIKKQRNIQ